MYKKIIYATDLGPQSFYIAEQALALAKLCQAALLVHHVIEPPLTEKMDFSQRESAIQQKQTLAQKSLGNLCSHLQIAKAQQLLTVGEGQAEILRVAKEQQCDLIVVGSHGVGGYLHGLGSTAHHVITYAHCNVLIVQVAHLKEIIEKTFPNPKAHPWQTPKTWENLRFSSGFGEEVKRGPRLSPRPPGSPYRGGTRKSEDDLESDEKSDTE